MTLVLGMRLTLTISDFFSCDLLSSTSLVLQEESSFHEQTATSQIREGWWVDFEKA
jgi:hypothetical protein